MSISAKLLDLLERSVLIQSLSTLACVGVLLYLIATNQPVPEVLSQLTWALLGVYLGSKIENTKLSRREMKG